MTISYQNILRISILWIATCQITSIEIYNGKLNSLLVNKKKKKNQQANKRLKKYLLNFQVYLQNSAVFLFSSASEVCRDNTRKSHHWWHVLVHQLSFVSWSGLIQSFNFLFFFCRIFVDARGKMLKSKLKLRRWEMLKTLRLVFMKD